MALPINLFNAEWYLRTYPDVARVVESGLITAEQHFFGFGRFENRAPGPLFDPEYYLATNADVREAGDQRRRPGGCQVWLDHCV